MANEPYTITNQKIYFVKLTLTDWQAAIDSPSKTIAAIKAFQERAAFHLYSAVWALYNEIASYYRFPLLNQPVAFKEFLTASFVEQNPSPELNELVTLLEDANSFLSVIDQAWQALFNSAIPQKSSIDIIAITQLGNSLDTLQDAENCLKQLSDLVVRFRAGLSEY
ncbi:DUF6586 family protein [Entomomonas asaccharolytica]|uniref:Uncharacterized protein n=1 Tax=Entomomonas asaccharolytica TaxID=2785331 RepID=A0A974NCY6_9GAMM|nr:DUF6586 family protein [Entomomonas asaccharolytica]QQP84358.1 hypothetical protein JHT90_07925 [Entomomonas asaccharolytica]